MTDSQKRSQPVTHVSVLIPTLTNADDDDDDEETRTESKEMGRPRPLSAELVFVQASPAHNLIL
jgi:hypothetical protein